MKWKITWLCRHVMRRTKNAITVQYGKKFYDDFYRGSMAELKELLPQIPHIGKSVFDTNYYFCCCYFPWFAALKKMELSSEDAVKAIWFLNEEYLKSWPLWIMKFQGKYYSRRHQKLGPWANSLSERDLHPDDWRVRFEKLDNNTWTFDIYECFVVKMAKRLGMQDMLPGVCRMDYLFSHYFDIEFRRKGTLADGFDRCDCWYRCPGKCDWPVPMDIEGVK
ncbi:MAG: L-2-amino-thiazoline-4-carboxylic acid hydrolase [Chitinophagales bacterium]